MWYQLDFSCIIGYTTYFSNIYCIVSEVFKQSLHKRIYIMKFNKKTNSFNMYRKNCLNDIIFQIRIQKLHDLDN